MYFTSDYMTGFVAGVGFTALGIYLYKKNQAQVDEFLRSQGIKVPGEKDYSGMTLEQLMIEKEHLEDLIAEREMEGPAPATQEPASKSGTGGEEVKKVKAGA